MRKTLVFLLLLSVKLTFGQLYDDFSDGNFTANPVWRGHMTLFNVNSAGQLKTSLSAVTQVIGLSTASALALNVKWEFFVQLNFDPSATNLTRIYLVSDEDDLTGPLNGYFVQIGESGATDSYDLYRQTGSNVTKIIDGMPKSRANPNFLSTTIRVTRDQQGHWELYSARDQAASFMSEGSTTDLTHTRSRWFGVYCKYTATRSDGFTFDDFNVSELIPDTTPPQLQRIKMISPQAMQVTFSEPPDSLSARLPAHYAIKETGTVPASVQSTALDDVYELYFERPFETGRYTLVVNHVKDLKGNEIAPGSEMTTFYIRPYPAVRGDIVINEIMVDPSPPAGLPEAEYVELWNTTSHYILLEGWKFKDLTSTAILKADTLPPHSYLILCARADTLEFKVYGKTTGLSPWPSLNNDKDRLSLFNNRDELIDEVFYQDSWYKDMAKNKGGYSLELIDPQNRCKGIQNWQASIHITGGSPGTANSVYRQQLSILPPKAERLVQLSDTTIRIFFNKSIDSAAAAEAYYHINNGVWLPVAVMAEAPAFTSVMLQFSTPLNRGMPYELTMSGICDCAGNIMDADGNRLSFFKAKAIQPGDVLISEVMNNPRPGGVDFIEIYNHAGHVLDLTELWLASTNTDGSPASLRQVSKTTLYMESKSYWVLSADPEMIKKQYALREPHQVVGMSMPAYPNEKGTVVLMSNALEIDRFSYHEQMHFPLLKQVKGVSLERTSFERSANENGNFKSAAATAGFATPTAKNSQAEELVQRNKVWAERKVFSPDGDGFDDILRLHYALDEQDYLASVTVYDDKGRLVRRLLKNNTLAPQGMLSWDGLDDQGVKSKVGLYVICWQLYTLKGRKKEFREVVALVQKL